MQIQSDLLDCDIVRTSTAETTARGAAFLAGLATGVWKDTDELRALWKEAHRFLPAGKTEEIAKRRKGWTAAVNTVKKDLNGKKAFLLMSFNIN